MATKRDDVECTSCSNATTTELFLCCGCWSFKCAKQSGQVFDQDAPDDSHTRPSSRGIRVRGVKIEGQTVSGEELSAHEIINVSIEHGNCLTEEFFKIGVLKIDLVNIEQARTVGFLECFDSLSADLSNLAHHFDSEGRLLPGKDLNPEDLKNERHLAFIDEFVIADDWRGRGLGSPDVLYYTESNFRYSPPPVGRAAEVLFLRIIRFYERLDFVSLGTPSFSASHKIEVEHSYQISGMDWSKEHYNAVNDYKIKSFQLSLSRST